MTPQPLGERITDLERRMTFLETTATNTTTSLARIVSFVDKHEATEVERDKQQEQRHLENKARLDSISSKVSSKMAERSLTWTIAGVMVALASLFVGGLAIVVMVKVARSEIHSIMPISTNEPIFSRTRPADAAIPSTYAATR